MVRWDDEGLEQRFDRWVETGRQLVDGVAGARPGSRSVARGQGRRLAQRLNPGELGRWVEGKLDWLLDDEGDEDWREPWQAQREPWQAQSFNDRQISQRPSIPAQPGGRRRPLEAISKRGRQAARPVAPPPIPEPLLPDPPLSGEWPDDEAFSVSRWQRQPQTRQDLEGDAEPPTRGGRPLPRSSRSRLRR